MVTARQFEDRMAEIRRDYDEKGGVERMKLECYELIVETLESLGYAAGARIYKDLMNDYK